MLGDGLAAELREERRVRHPDGEPVQVAEHRRQVARRLDDAVGDAPREHRHVLVRHLADEEERDEVGAVVLDGAADERVVEDDALAVAGVLRERRAALDHAAAEDAARVVEALLLVVALGAKPLEHVEEARAVLGLVDREDAVVQAPRAARVRAEREDLEQRREPLLHRGRARRALREPLAPPAAPAR